MVLSKAFNSSSMPQAWRINEIKAVNLSILWHCWIHRIIRLSISTHLTNDHKCSDFHFSILMGYFLLLRMVYMDDVADFEALTFNLAPNLPFCQTAVSGCDSRSNQVL